jgi:hypothetical protein
VRANGAKGPLNGTKERKPVKKSAEGGSLPNAKPPMSKQGAASKGKKGTTVKKETAQGNTAKATAAKGATDKSTQDVKKETPTDKDDAQDEKKEKPTGKITEARKVTKPKPVYDMPGQTQPSPELGEPLAKFYTSLLKQRPESEIANKWYVSGLVTACCDNASINATCVQSAGHMACRCNAAMGCVQMPLHQYNTCRQHGLYVCRCVQRGLVSKEHAEEWLKKNGKSAATKTQAKPASKPKATAGETCKKSTGGKPAAKKPARKARDVANDSDSDSEEEVLPLSRRSAGRKASAPKKVQPKTDSEEEESKSDSEDVPLARRKSGYKRKAEEVGQSGRVPKLQKLATGKQMQNRQMVVHEPPLSKVLCHSLILSLTMMICHWHKGRDPWLDQHSNGRHDVWCIPAS